MRDDLKIVVEKNCSGEYFGEFPSFFQKVSRIPKLVLEYIGLPSHTFWPKKLIRVVFNTNFQNSPGTINWQWNLLTVILFIAFESSKSQA